MLELQTVNWGYNLTDGSRVNARLSAEQHGEVIVEAVTPNPCNDATTTALAARLVAAYNAVEGIPTETLTALAPGELARILKHVWQLMVLGAAYHPDEHNKYLEQVEASVQELHTVTTTDGFLGLFNLIE